MASPHGGARLGTRFGPYELRALIGVGGMGEVYRAFDTHRERMVAVKLLRPEVAADPNFQERFRRESRVAARLQEPHVIPVHDFGAIDGVLYIDMRLVDGASLKDVLRAEGPLEPGRAASIIAQVGAALDAAHAGGLVHRDIKPENVLLTADDFAYLVDFGIAHADEDASVTRTGMVIGSCAYMAAERFSGGPVGPPSDVYALTCLLYECLTGRPPFEAGDLRQLMSAHMFAPPPRPSAARAGVSRAFDDVIARGMAKQPGARYPSAGELARAATAAAASSQVAPAADVRPPTDTRQFSAMYPNPAATGYTPYPPPVQRAAPQAAGRARFGRTQVTLIAATVVLLGVAAVLGALLVSGGDAGSPARTPLAVPPATTTAEATEPTSTETTSSTTSATTTTSTTPSSTTSTTAGAVSMAGADTQGFIGHSARCDNGDKAAAMVRTANSLAVVCGNGPSGYYYRGERLSDGADLELANAVPAGGGFDAVNPADGARYEVRPDRLTIYGSGGVDSTEPALQYATQ
ncbi:serine/threonine-protein kinase [Mycobacterium sp. NPDC050041]|uniref:serine/threonine-protein kinase n=1 Tax=Mycobacterium sp. NPDC050041 TaxID=3364293 RepID=UPI003C2F2AAF